MRVDSIYMPDGIAMRYIPETGVLQVGFDYGILFGLKKE
jgi:hypothetical protein